MHHTDKLSHAGVIYDDAGTIGRRVLDFRIGPEGLARAFIDMGDNEGARGSLEEVIAEGNEDQKAEAKSLLDQI